jgi:hypothetical protein
MAKNFEWQDGLLGWVAGWLKTSSGMMGYSVEWQDDKHCRMAGWIGFWTKLFWHTWAALFRNLRKTAENLRNNRCPDCGSKQEPPKYMPETLLFESPCLIVTLGCAATKPKYDNCIGANTPVYVYMYMYMYVLIYMYVCVSVCLITQEPWALFRGLQKK